MNYIYQFTTAEWKREESTKNFIWVTQKISDEWEFVGIARQPELPIQSGRMNMVFRKEITY